MGFYLLVFIIVLVFLLLKKHDKRGFDRKGIHRNGTRYDDSGYDVNGFDKNGYNKYGFDRKGYDAQGFNDEGYNIDGRDITGKYNRLYDVRSYDKEIYNKDGFLNPKIYPISISNHARERIYERMPNGESINANKLVLQAYAYGKSARQIMKTSAGLLYEIESRYDNGIALIFNGYIYIFSEENVLITMYQNDKGIV